MQDRLTQNDISNTVNVECPQAVGRTIRRLFEARYAGTSFEILERVFDDVDRLFDGRLWGCAPCDTPYHDLRHTLDVTLATARLIESHDRVQKGPDRLGADRALLGVITAALHDAGYMYAADDPAVANGSEYTRVHVSRSAHVLARYLPLLGLGRHAELAGRIVHFTGFEVAFDRIGVEHPLDLRLGHMIGAADLVAQMSDRHYLEKCRDYLYPELVLAGIAGEMRNDGSGRRHFESPEDLLRQTPDFHERVVRYRLDHAFAGIDEYAGIHFGGRNLYREQIAEHLAYLNTAIARGDFSALRRHCITLSRWEGLPVPAQAAA